MQTKRSKIKAAAATVRHHLKNTGIDEQEFYLSENHNFGTMLNNAYLRRLTASVKGWNKLTDALDALINEIEK